MVSPRPGLPSERPPAAAGRERDRRRHLRFSLRGAGSAEYIPGVLSVFGWGDHLRAREVVDLSEGGTCLLTDRPLPPGTVLHLEISIPARQEKIRAYGETRWSRAGAGNEAYQAGVMFLELDPSEEAKISRLRRTLAPAR